MKKYNQFVVDMLIESITDPIVQLKLRTALLSGKPDELLKIYKEYMRNSGEHKDAKFKAANTYFKYFGHAKKHKPIKYKYSDVDHMYYVQ